MRPPRMLRGGCLWLAALWLAGGSPPPERGPPLRVPHDHSHGFAYDHEAVLGPEQARAFDQLSPEESRHRLGLLVGLMDGDGDGAVSLAELRGWLLRTRGRARAEELQRGRERYDQNGDGAVSWDEYRGEAYGNPGEPAPTGGTPQREGHPIEGHPLYSPEPGVPEPSWVAEERAQFRGGRDVDGDGRLSPPEVGQWLRPPSSDWAGHEAAHLLHASDRDQVGNWEHWGGLVGTQGTGGTGRHSDI
uniref:EF-hand domain-containing protein n=1 Tax=Anas zonorhyncha TaxID=75864 RepID=A0A8B9UPC1_9AVES